MPSPVDLLLAGIGGCTAADVDVLTLDEHLTVLLLDRTDAEPNFEGAKVRLNRREIFDDPFEVRADKEVTIVQGPTGTG
jgi:uncharacterized OsmC-like protein